ncbi:MAG: YihY/virulence factor BrkB family protein [Sphingomonas sp.]|nr:YihY/virulence factor BrkB family protein [Sphingomonas sp.]
MQQSPHSPEARRKRLAGLHAQFGREKIRKLRKSERPWEVLKRTVYGVYSDGFIHAGNLAYISLLALFPFLILATAVAKLIGRDGASDEAIFAILSQLPPDVAETLAEPLFEVTTGKTGALLWVGALVGLWTAGSFIETIRDILRRAYGIRMSAPFWEYRLASIGLIIGAVFLLFIAFSATVLLTSLQALITNYLPVSGDFAGSIGLFRIVPSVVLFLTVYAIFYALTPLRYRRGKGRVWPGAIFITLWWLLTATVLPEAIGLVGGYGRTYGSMAGVMVVLIFFYVVGLGVVFGAEFNAALADSGDTALKGETYEGPYAGELIVEEPGEDEEQGDTR